VHKKFSWEASKEERVGSIGIDGSIILKQIVNKWGVGV
jgi:hypothetical protein